MTLDPQAEAFIASMSAVERPAWQDVGPEAAREAFAGMGQIFGIGPPVHRVENLVIPDNLRVRLYRPSDQPDLPALLWFHGGGWVMGDLETHDAMCRRLTVAADAVVISVDYPLAPEHRFPSAAESCFDALRYFSDHASDHGLDVTRLFVGGDSAGGHLAASVSAVARRRGGPLVCGQVLVYPVVSPNFDTKSYLRCAEGYGLTRTDMRWFWDCYVDAIQNDDTWPIDLLQMDVAGMPPTFLITAQYDVLCDEGTNLAAAIESADVDVTHSHFMGTLHGFVHFAACFDNHQQAIDEIGEFVRQRCP
ncbi:alpha/beta hydrolase [Crateriforma conspicua]|uniref:Carboxylesterase NlhH n=1 Tax=Crateriforma conspicua TaxID=2527996 RepID=A0A5C5XU97_9PLAN|nr:alpha/beta hydrolase [Crateriforma conspicua]TWT65595.1 Carboxylesterase NlhH [Crateriforma conspicua]